MKRNKSISAIRFLVLIVVFATFSSSVSYGFTGTRHESNWDPSYRDSLSVLPAQAKKPGWAKPKAKPKTKKIISTTSARSAAKSKSTLPKRISNLRIHTPKGATLKKAIPSSAGRALTKNVKATAKLLAKSALTTARKDQAKSHLRKYTSSKGAAAKWLPKALKQSTVLSRGDNARSKLHKYKNTRGSFKGEVLQIKLKEPLVVHRRAGGKSDEKGHWFSLKKYRSGAIARRFSALPNNNSGRMRNSYLIPAGSTIFIGKAASRTKEQWAGSYATGGGIQIYAPKFGKIKKL